MRSISHLSIAAQWVFSEDAILALHPGSVAAFKAWMRSVRAQAIRVGLPVLAVVLLFALLTENVSFDRLAMVLASAFFFGGFALGRGEWLLRQPPASPRLLEQMEVACQNSGWSRAFRDRLLAEGHTLCAQHCKLIIRQAELQKRHHS